MKHGNKINYENNGTQSLMVFSSVYTRLDGKVIGSEW